MHDASAKKDDPRELLQRLMKDRGFVSARALALAADISQPTLTRYLAGKTTDMDTSTWRALAKALEVSVAELLAEVPLLSDSTNALRRHLQVMESLSQEQREVIIETAKNLAERQAKRN